MSSTYQPPYKLTSSILHHTAEISELVGVYSATADSNLTPQLRRGNLIRTIQASLAIENNTMTVEQVTAILDGKKVMGLPREIQEVRNAFKAYEQLDRWNTWSEKDLLEAHRLLMEGLADNPGAYRESGVGIYRGTEVMHMAPPADRVPFLMSDLCLWLKNTKEHPLIAGCVFHYELEFIHPFTDGNGRLGRLWQTLILSKWKPLWKYLPVETLVRERQEAYYNSLGESDSRGDVTPFIEFMIKTLRDALEEYTGTDQVSDQVSDQVKALLPLLKKGALSASELMNSLRLSHRPTFRKNYLEPALASELIERTQPDSPSSPTQKYRLTDKGRGMAPRPPEG